MRQRAIQAEDKEERRSALLDAAERLLLRQGEGMPAVADVAEAAGVGKGTVYLYFPSKEELFLALHERGVDAFFSALIRLLEHAPAVGFAEVFALTRRFIVEPPLFLPLASRCLGSFDKAIPPDVAARFRDRQGRRLADAGAGLERRFDLPAGEGIVLLRHSYALIIGLWQMQAARGRGAMPCGAEHPAFQWDYATELERAMLALWTGRVGSGRA